ncbi:MAG: MBOAT family protein, partial [Lachnospiraceae bacterium]|nr:MBOAT family protein [Lachnospiraceae bacterium]
MAFGNLFFVLSFLPVSLILYYLIPGRFPMVRNIVLVLISLLFYSWGNPQYLILILFSVFYNYFAALQMSVYG